MTVRLSTGLRDKMLQGGVGGGLKGALDGGYINIYTGPQPISADAGATGTLLGTVSVNAEGTGLTFAMPASGAIDKSPDETWRFMGLAAGTAGYCRFYPAGGNPAAVSTTEARIDGAIASSGGEMTISNISVTVGSPNTIDQFTIILGAQ